MVATGETLDHVRAEFADAKAQVFSGQAAEAADRLQALIDLPFYDSQLHYWLAAALGASGDSPGFRSALRDAQTFQALELISDGGGDMERLVVEGPYALELGKRLYVSKLMGAATSAFAQAVSNDQSTAEATLMWGLSLQHQGRIDEAIDVFTAAAEQFPSSRNHEYLLYALFFGEDGVGRHAQEVRRWADAYAPPHDPDKRFANAPQAGRRLRIGYVAPGFLNTQLKQFFQPVLENHTDDVEVFLYARNEAGLAGAPDVNKRVIGSLSNQQAAAAISADRIDVLVDLWGHTGLGRLQVFALQPAPVQAAWINYVQSTGLAAMDYVIHADGMDGPEDEALFVEKIWRLGPIIAPFRPGPRAEPTRTPALHKGHVTFGSFNHPAKLSDATVAAWARILRGRQDSRLLLKYAAFVDPVLQSATRARFASHGVDPAVILFSGHSTGDEYLAAFGDLDLALDPSPCTGGTTSSEMVSQGVPLLTLRGPNFYSRLGVLRLEPLGLKHLIAESWDDYVARALALTEDLAELDGLRQSMRSRFDNSVLRDEAGFTLGLEAAFRRMYGAYEARTGLAAAGPSRAVR
jgi:predicted O-linked N-acetylglucosamine transferase (SPINDLY family)